MFLVILSVWLFFMLILFILSSLAREEREREYIESKRQILKAIKYRDKL